MESTQQPVGTDVRNPTAFVTLAATALAIFVGGLLFAPIDPITKAWLLAVLIVAIWIDAVSYAGGFRLVSAQLQAGRYAHAVRLNSSLVLDLDGIVSRSLRVFGTQAYVYAFYYAANSLVQAAQKLRERAGRDVAGVERIEEVVQVWNMISGSLGNVAAEVSRLCAGQARTDTGSFVAAVELMRNYVTIVHYVADRFVLAASQTSGLTVEKSARDGWNDFRERANGIFADFNTLILKTNTAFSTSLSPFENRIGEPW